MSIKLIRLITLIERTQGTTNLGTHKKNSAYGISAFNEQHENKSVILHENYLREGMINGDSLEQQIKKKVKME